MQMTMLLKNLGLAGGFLLLAQTGAGAWSLDARLRRG
jgi:putative oxidoreductase